jgi:hypothetical protein
MPSRAARECIQGMGFDVQVDEGNIIRSRDVEMFLFWGKLEGFYTRTRGPESYDI